MGVRITCHRRRGSLSTLEYGQDTPAKAGDATAQYDGEQNESHHKVYPPLPHFKGPFQWKMWRNF
jgi:hypothetical protein